MSNCLRWGLACGILWVALAARASAAEFHVAVEGTPRGDGSAERPWDLATALAAPAEVRPGDTLWLHGGTYRGGYDSKLTGSPDAPIVVRGMPGERVTIDTHARDERDQATLYIHGADAIYRDFEVTCSHPQRITEIPGSWPDDIRRGAVDVRADRIRLLNLVIHDLSVGVGFWSEGEGGEISGCLIYHNGWRGPDRGHGHAIYAQNARGTKRIADNILFHQFGYGIHVYGSEKAFLEGFDIEGNITFENGCLTQLGANTPGILVGGGCPAKRIAVRDNVVVAGNIRLGYTWGDINEDVVCTGNYCDQGLVVRDFRQATVRHNTIVAHSNAVTLEGVDRLLLAGLQWDDNRYFITDGRWGQCSIVEGDASRGLPFDDWRSQTGLDANSTLVKGTPDELRVVVRPNPHEAGRAHVAVLNPAELPVVEVDLSAVLQAGQSFRIVSPKDYYGEPIVSGKYDGQPVRVPMRPVAAVAPVGMADAELPSTEPRFAAFVVLPANPGE